MAGPAAPQRPLSPHLQIWRWHVTMASSILHRATGVALYVCLALFVVWLAALAMGGEAYAWIDALFHSWFGQLKLYGAFGVLAYHWANGLRHLLLDSGRLFELKAANSSAWYAILFAFIAPAALWAVLNFGGLS
ncbi:MAG: succinate dehydrogenase, cytochrome b556 subunit [Hyphomonadaceae bacterium]